MLQNPLQRSYTINNQRIIPLVAGMVGIIAGAAGVTTLALSDKDIRKKVGQRATEMRITLQKWSNTKLQEYKADPIQKKDNRIEEPAEMLDPEDIKN